MLLNNNQRELTRLAARYRLNLDGNEEQLVTPVYENLVLNEILTRFKWYETRVDRVIKSGNHNFFLKNLKTFCYAYFKTLDAYKSTLETNNYSLNNEIKEIESFYKKQVGNFESIKKQLANPGSSFYVRENFFQRNLEESYDLIDEKTKTYFQKSNLAKSLESEISSSIKESFDIKPLRANVLGRSESGEKVEASSEISYLWRAGKRFKYIVYQNEKLLREKKDLNKASLEILFDFGFIQKLNKITIDEGSYFPGTLDEANLKYYDKIDKTWKNINISKRNSRLKKTNYFFDEIETNKIIIKIDHYKCLNKVPNSFLDAEELFDLEVLNPQNNQDTEIEMYNVFDLSIDEVSFKYEIYKKRSIYREKKAIELQKAQFFSLRLEKEIPENCFLECEIELQQFLNKDKWSWNILPIPTSYEIEEIIFFKDGKAKFTFPVKAGNISNVSIFDKDRNAINNFEEISKVKESTYETYNDYIESDTLNQVVVKYLIHDFIEYELGKYENGIFNFNNKVKNKKVLLRPRFIFRNINDENKSASVYKYTIETNKTDFNQNVSSRYNILRGD